MGSLFEGVHEQLKWADTCLENAEQNIIAYIQNEAFKLEETFDRSTEEVVRKVKLAKPVPMSIKGNLRNAILDIKHSFDMSLHAAANTMGETRFKANYPWADSPDGLEIILTKRQKESRSKLPENLLREIRRQAPYKTDDETAKGNDLVRETASMANNKHSIGIVTAAQVQGVHYGQITVDGSLNLGSHWNKKKQEMIIMRSTGFLRFEDPKMTGNVFFERVGTMGMQPAIQTARTFSDRAKEVLSGFETVCREPYTGDQSLHES